MFVRTVFATCLAITALGGCGSSALVQCKLAAVERLPDDPFAVNGHDVANLVARLQNCQAQQGSDGGPQ